MLEKSVNEAAFETCSKPLLMILTQWVDSLSHDRLLIATWGTIHDTSWFRNHVSLGAAALILWLAWERLWSYGASLVLYCNWKMSDSINMDGSMSNSINMECLTIKCMTKTNFNTNRLMIVSIIWSHFFLCSRGCCYHWKIHRVTEKIWSFIWQQEKSINASLEKDWSRKSGAIWYEHAMI